MPAWRSVKIETIGGTRIELLADRSVACSGDVDYAIYLEDVPKLRDAVEGEVLPLARGRVALLIKEGILTRVNLP